MLSFLRPIASLCRLADICHELAFFSRAHERSTRSDSLDIYWQSQSVRARLVPHTAVAVEKQHLMDSLRRVRALNALPTVTALPANNVLQSNRKDALRIYLEVTAAGAAQLTEAQFDVVSPIAQQCPLAGGSAVCMARALYQMKEQKHFDDFDLCAIADERSAKATPKPLSDRVLLWPNPTDGRLQLFLPGMEAGQEVRLRVADISGRTMLERSLATADGNLALDASRLAPGVYFCLVSTAGQTFQPVKFVISR
ncbi:MAG: T9SS type A sorting domain-containing protein [Saprospiraceae bacterium]|nr:T9SS type A sorting domain-containing protein [Saprospiraceae bacterium]